MTGVPLLRSGISVCLGFTLLCSCTQYAGQPETLPQLSAPAGATPVPSSATRGTSSGDLLYVTYDHFTGAVTTFYTYPGLKKVGSVTGGVGLCSDPAGDVFVVFNGGWYEYAHGQTTLKNKYINSDYDFQHCSVDQKSGNLAISIKDAGVAVFQNASGAPSIYKGPFGDRVFCGYDNAGNLFVFGNSYDIRPPKPQLEELVNRGDSLVSLSLSQKIRESGQIQWDGKHMTIGDENGPILYRLRLAKNAATVIGSSMFRGVPGGHVQQSWIYGNRVIFPFDVTGSSGKDVGIWKYPEGGRPTATLRGPSPTTNQAVTISVGSASR